MAQADACVQSHIGACSTARCSPDGDRGQQICSNMKNQIIKKSQ